MQRPLPAKKQPFKRVPNPARKLHAGHPGFNPAPKGSARFFPGFFPYEAVSLFYI